MNKVESLGKFLWAVSAFPEDKELQFKTARLLAQIAGESDTPIEPVCVLGPTDLLVPPHMFVEGAKQYRIEADRIVNEWVRELKIPNMVAPMFLVQDRYSLTDAVNSLLRYAKKTEATLIGLSTRTKKPFERFLLGSFAEDVILRSDVPLLISNPQAEVRSLSRILFATDFDEQGLKAFNKLLPVAKMRKAELSLFYQFEYALPDFSSGLYMGSGLQEVLDKHREEKRHIGEGWVDLAARQGIKASVRIGEGNGQVPQAILDAAKAEKADLVAVTARTGQVGAVLLGSTARSVVRRAECPVWVIHA